MMALVSKVTCAHLLWK